MCKGYKEHKEFKEYKMPYVANGDRLYYNSFNELTDDLKDKFKHEVTRLCSYNKSKKAYVDFINKLNENGDKLVSDYIEAKTKVRVHYGKCGHTHPKGEGVTPSSYKQCHGCGVCSGSIVVKGVNDIATTHPQYIKYFVNIEDTYTHTRCSGDKVEMKCPICGTIKVMCISNLMFQGFSCLKCGDGISRPNKVMTLVVEALGLNYELEYVVEGYSQYRYDIYLTDYKQAMENDGGQHYAYLDDKLKDKKIWNNKTGMEIHYIDLGKESVLMNEGLGLIVIDCRESNIDYIKNSVENHPFFQQFDLSNIDWKEIDKQAQKSKKVEACLYWKEQKEINKDLTPSIMAEIFKVDKTTIFNWLTWGNESGLCTYSGKEEREARTRRLSNFVYLIKQDGTKEYDEAISQRELARLTGINKSTIGRRSKDGKSLDGRNAQYDSKYIGCYIVNADEWDAQHN